MKAEDLIQELIEKTKGLLNDCEKLKQLSDEELNKRPGEGKWSALEALEHLNYYSEFYIPEIGKRLKESKRSKSDVFKTGKLGNYFAKSVMPQAKKMKTFKNMDPANSDSTLDRKVLEDFVQHQHKMLELINESRNHDLTKVKTSISISKIIKLRLGDTFRVVVYHNERHMLQALKAGGVLN